MTSRGEIVRGMVEFMERSEIDFTQFASGQDLERHLTEYFKGAAHRGRLPTLLQPTLLAGSIAVPARCSRRPVSFQTLEPSNAEADVATSLANR